MRDRRPKLLVIDDGKAAVTIVGGAHGDSAAVPVVGAPVVVAAQPAPVAPMGDSATLVYMKSFASFSNDGFGVPHAASSESNRMANDFLIATILRIAWRTVGS